MRVLVERSAALVFVCPTPCQNFVLSLVNQSDGLAKYRVKLFMVLHVIVNLASSFLHFFEALNIVNWCCIASFLINFTN